VSDAPPRTRLNGVRDRADACDRIFAIAALVLGFSCLAGTRLRHRPPTLEVKKRRGRQPGLVRHGVRSRSSAPSAGRGPNQPDHQGLLGRWRNNRREIHSGPRASSTAAVTGFQNTIAVDLPSESGHVSRSRPSTPPRIRRRPTTRSSSSRSAARTSASTPAVINQKAGRVTRTASSCSPWGTTAPGNLAAGCKLEIDLAERAPARHTSVNIPALPRRAKFQKKLPFHFVGQRNTRHAQHRPRPHRLRRRSRPPEQQPPGRCACAERGRPPWLVRLTRRPKPVRLMLGHHGLRRDLPEAGAAGLRAPPATSAAASSSIPSTASAPTPISSPSPGSPGVRRGDLHRVTCAATRSSTSPRSAASSRPSAFPYYRHQAAETPWWRLSEREARAARRRSPRPCAPRSRARGPVTADALTDRGRVEAIDWSAAGRAPARPRRWPSRCSGPVVSVVVCRAERRGRAPVRRAPAGPARPTPRRCRGRGAVRPLGRCSTAAAAAGLLAPHRRPLVVDALDGAHLGPCPTRSSPRGSCEEVEVEGGPDAVPGPGRRSPSAATDTSTMKTTGACASWARSTRSCGTARSSRTGLRVRLRLGGLQTRGEARLRLVCVPDSARGGARRAVRGALRRDGRRDRRHGPLAGVGAPFRPPRVSASAEASRRGDVSPFRSARRP
jgi:hypothetical protein